MKTAFLLLSLFLSIILLDSCVESTDGCLDTFSSNYSLLADKECDDCCTYPNLNFTTKYLYGIDTDIDSSLYYQNNSNSYFKLRSFYLVLSEFVLHGDEGDYNIKSKTDGKEIIDDLLGIKFKNGTNSPGGIAVEDSIRSVDFKLGLPTGLDEPDNPDKDYGVIELLSDSLYVDVNTNKFYKMIIDLEVDSMDQSLVSLEFPNLDMTLKSDVVAGTTRGNRMTIQLSIDFMRLFNGIDFQEANVEEIAKSLIMENIAGAIEVN